MKKRKASEQNQPGTNKTFSDRHQTKQEQAFLQCFVVVLYSSNVFVFLRAGMDSNPKGVIGLFQVLQGFVPV